MFVFAGTILALAIGAYIFTLTVRHPQRFGKSIRKLVKVVVIPLLVSLSAAALAETITEGSVISEPMPSVEEIGQTSVHSESEGGSIIITGNTVTINLRDESQLR